MQKRMLILLATLMVAALTPTIAQAQSIDSVPGCATYFEGYVYTAEGYQPSYRAWCGSDEQGW
jgi:hypothetical protein